ncbi:MAG: putative F420-dependent oxidoreductase [Ilumatobacteraceae bacterium]|nr:putative F420-dependent oxidoreductase [Ilumatobacteraceae bacterium]
MRIGIFSGSTNDGTIDQLVAEARQAEAEGFAGFWVSQIFGHDALTALAVIGREVPRIELGTGVVPTFPRHPMMLAQQALTVNAASDRDGSGGRLALGIGLSHKMVVENMWGLSYDKPVRHLREYLEVLVPMLDGKPVSFDGEDYQVHAGVSVPGGSRPGVFVAALGEQMLRVTAALADGTVTWCTGPDTLRKHTVPTLTAAAEAAGRPAPRIISALPVCVTGDRPSALARAAALFQMYGYLPSYRAMLDMEGAAGPEDIAIIGNAAEVSDRIRALADVGVTDFTAAEFGGNPDEVAETRQTLRALL